MEHVADQNTCALYVGTVRIQIVPAKTVDKKAVEVLRSFSFFN
jgi:hypothetical protein